MLMNVAMNVTVEKLHKLSEEDYMVVANMVDHLYANDRTASKAVALKMGEMFCDEYGEAFSKLAE